MGIGRSVSWGDSVATQQCEPKCLAMDLVAQNKQCIF